MAEYLMARADKIRNKPYETEADMIADPALVPGMVAETLGKSSVADGEGQTFYIVASGGDVTLANGNEAQIVSLYKTASGVQTGAGALNSRVIGRTNLSAMKALDASLLDDGALVRVGRGQAKGKWEWVVGDGSTLISSDPRGGIYAKADSTPATAGYFRRVWAWALDESALPITWFGYTAGANMGAIINDMISLRNNIDLGIDTSFTLETSVNAPANTKLKGHKVSATLAGSTGIVLTDGGHEIEGIHFTGTANTCIFANSTTGVADEISVKYCRAEGTAGLVVVTSPQSPINEKSIDNNENVYGSIVVQSCQGLNTVKPLLEFTRCFNVQTRFNYIENCYDVSLADGLRLTGIRFSNCRNANSFSDRLKDQGIDQPDETVHCIQFDSGSTDWTVIKAYTWNSGGNGVSVNDTCGDGLVSKCQLYYGRFGEGVTLHGGSPGSINNITIEGNLIHGRGRVPNATDKIGDIYTMGGAATLLAGIFCDNARNINTHDNVITYCTRGINFSFGTEDCSSADDSIVSPSLSAVIFDRATRPKMKNVKIFNPFFEKGNGAFSPGDRDKAAFVVGNASTTDGAEDFQIDGAEVIDDNGNTESIIYSESTTRPTGNVSGIELHLASKPAGFKYFKIAPANVGEHIHLKNNNGVQTWSRTFSGGANGDFLTVDMASFSTARVSVKWQERTSAGADEYRHVEYMIQKEAGAPTSVNTTVANLGAGAGLSSVVVTISDPNVTFSLSGNDNQVNLECSITGFRLTDVEFLPG